MFGDDEALPPFPSPQIVGSPRATTPSKQRAITPVKQPQRSSSTESKLTKAIMEAQSCSREKTRSLSRRRRRQWENVHLIDLNAHIDDPLMSANFKENEDTPEYVGIAPVEWKSSMSHLFLPENAEEMESFRKCRSVLSSFSDVRTKHAFRKDEWEQVEMMWVERVEKRLRMIISKIVSENEAFQLYIQSVEDLLLYFIDKSQAPTRSSIQMPLLSVLEPGQDIRCQGGTLYIPLINSPVHRLMLHGVCQFLSLHSQVKILKIG